MNAEGWVSCPTVDRHAPKAWARSADDQAVNRDCGVMDRAAGFESFQQVVGEVMAVVDRHAREGADATRTGENFAMRSLRNAAPWLAKST